MLQDPETFGEYRLSYRTGDIVSPRIDAAEPLSLELRDFCDADRDRNDAALVRGDRARGRSDDRGDGPFERSREVRESLLVTSIRSVFDPSCCDGRRPQSPLGVLPTEVVNG